MPHRREEPGLRVHRVPQEMKLLGTAIKMDLAAGGRSWPATARRANGRHCLDTLWLPQSGN